MFWDSWDLPVKENGYIEESCKDLALYFINIMLFKKLFDNKFKVDYPQREKKEEESIEEYNNYLTQHLNAYRELLNKQNIQYMQDTDIHLYDKLNILTYDNELIIHPQLGRTMNNLNLIPMLCCLSLYDFSEVLKSQKVSLRYKSIQNYRSSIFYNIITDFALLLSILKHNIPEVQIPQMIVAKSTPNFISRFIQKLYFKRYKYFGNVQSSTIEWLQK